MKNKKTKSQVGMCGTNDLVTGKMPSKRGGAEDCQGGLFRGKDTVTVIRVPQAVTANASLSKYHSTFK